MTERPTTGYITEADLVDHICSALATLGGKAPKSQVESMIYERNRNVFEQPYFQEGVAGGIPRWKHYIAWAKEQAKHQGLVKRPSQSGRGLWELADSAKH